MPKFALAHATTGPCSLQVYCPQKLRTEQCTFHFLYQFFLKSVRIITSNADTRKINVNVPNVFQALASLKKITAQNQA